MDIRHEAKPQDGELISWLRQKRIPFIGVYTKADKLSGNKRNKHAAILDAGHSISSHNRVLFSAKNYLGREILLNKLAELAES
jgi:GTP-binding protein EngB required for normal cell division